ncbi:Urb2/Npa2 family-domain-containing protein [Desarmillaria tabescens]|uniref:Urb2/Npa2 family-domain-containing protein n=1 Tax=Armillaria tabescens TaxID=1929756 RepID=A0AA39U1R4_ARMTA|nr:Urb2/Npa2 family-domain-containing protein [Desarmillaria tabescens]KAK0465330.1 Urb2/Npa2 family-domain-containing protein [Desarmillaria tabescens]
MESFRSSQGFVRALKSSSDPPSPEGPLKIDIARQAWDNKTFYVPRKEEVIADWVLSRLLKEKSTILDVRYWTLLLDVISSPQVSLRTWLLPLLNRIPVLPVVVALLRGLSDVDVSARQHLTFLTRNCLAIIWPLAVHKFTAENLLECFGIFLLSARCCQSDKNHDQIGQWLLHSFLSSFNNSSMKKKLYSTFTQMYLGDWMTYISTDVAASILGENIYTAGVEILFSLDILRQSVDGDLTLFEVLEGVNMSSLLVNLPRLFRSFVTSVKRFRGALFGQGSSRQSIGGIEEVRSAGMHFFISSQPLLNASGLEVEAWTAQVELLKVINEEALFTGSQRDLEGIFTKVIENAISVLSTASVTEEQKIVTSLVAGALTMIARIEYSILEAALPKILPLILVRPTADKSFFSFLEILLDYHSKTRTINTHLSVLLSAPERDRIALILDDVRTTYQIATDASALVHPVHFDRLVICTRTFLTSTQILPTIHSIFENLASCSDAFSAAQETLSEHLKKAMKGKLPAVAVEDIIHDLDVSAFCLTLSCRISSVILSAISQQSLPSSIREELHRSADTFRSASLNPTLSKSVKFLHKMIGTHSREVWGSSVGASSLLRLQYSLSAQRCHSLTQEDSWDGKTLTKLMMLLDKSCDEHGYPVYPAMNFEIFRTLLDSVGHHVEENTSLVDKLIAFVAQGSLPLDAGRTHIALLHLLIGQWLPTIDVLASREQLSNLVRVIVGSGNAVLQHFLTSAQVWELPSLRNAFLAYFDEATSALGTDDQRSEESIRTDSTTHRDIIVVFRILLAVPVEYFSRQSWLNFAKRALRADTVICGLINEDEGYISQSKSVLRTFARRTFSHLGVIDRHLEDVPSYLEHLMISATTALTNQEVTLATLDLVEFYVSSLLKAEKNHRSATSELLSNFHQRLQLSSFLERDVRSQCLQRTAQLLIKEHQPDSFSDEFRAKLLKIQNDFKAFLEPSMTAMAANDINADDLKFPASGLLGGWYCIISLQRWLTPEGVNLQVYGHHLCLKFCQLDENHCYHHAITTTFAILKEEFLYSTDVTRRALLDIVTEAYVVLYPTFGSEDEASMDAILADIYGELSAPEFTHVTETVSRSLLSSEHTTASLQCMVGVAMLLLQEIPKTTFQIAQNFTTFCITTFGSRNVFISVSAIRQQVLRFLVQRCRDRSTTLRPVDVSAIWSLIAKLLSGAREQDEGTSTAAFHDIVTVIRSLVRFRRDLVIQTLPHLGYILRQLLMIMRRPRAQLGAKQSAMVAQSYPSWINPQQPLGNEEAKALSRLLESLATKSIVKVQSSNTEAPKAESLVGPLSKHAAYVLTAHIDAVSDPLCVFPASLRKELEPGLFALCDMINEHSRDAIMLSSLDVGGKATMKALWKEYEKQRYIGKG